MFLATSCVYPFLWTSWELWKRCSLLGGLSLVFRQHSFIAFLEPCTNLLCSWCSSGQLASPLYVFHKDGSRFLVISKCEIPFLVGHLWMLWLLPMKKLLVVVNQMWKDSNSAQVYFFFMKKRDTCSYHCLAMYYEINLHRKKNLYNEYINKRL